MNEQEQADIFKVMNVSDLPDRYFVYNEQKPNFLTPGYLELEPDPLPPLIEECIRNRPSDIYFSPDNNNNENENENNSCTNDKDDTDMCHNESGYLLSRTDLSSLIQKKLIYQQKILTVPINSSCTNRSSISNLSSSTTTTNNNNNILNQISLINNNNNNKSSKNSPNLLYV